MPHDRVDSRAGPGVGMRGRSLLPLVFTAFLVAFLICVSVGSSAAGSVSPAAPAQGHRASGTTLAVVRAGGASLYDDAGQPILELPAGAPLRVDGRTSDNRWFHGAARDGTAGWASADALVIFGVSNVPVREGFSAPAPKTPPAVTSGATSADAMSAGRHARRRHLAAGYGCQRDAAQCAVRTGHRLSRHQHGRARRSADGCGPQRGRRLDPGPAGGPAGRVRLGQRPLPHPGRQRPGFACRRAGCRRGICSLGLNLGLNLGQRA